MGNEAGQMMGDVRNLRTAQGTNGKQILRQALPPILSLTNSCCYLASTEGYSNVRKTKYYFDDRKYSNKRCVSTAFLLSCTA